MPERSNSLWLAILVNRKCIPLEIGYEVLLIIEDGGVQDDLFDLLLENESPTVASIGSLPRPLIYGLASVLHRHA